MFIVTSYPETAAERIAHLEYERDRINCLLEHVRERVRTDLDLETINNIFEVFQDG